MHLNKVEKFYTEKWRIWKAVSSYVFVLILHPGLTPFFSSALWLYVFVRALPSTPHVPPLHLITPRQLVGLSFW